MSVVYGMPAEQYHAHPALGSTSTKMLAKHPPAVYRWQANNPQPPKAAFDLGSVAHSVILEGEESTVAVMDVPDKRTKAWKDFDAETRAAGKTPLTIGEWRQVEEMRDAVMDHPVAGNLIVGAEAEVSFFGELHGVPVKARPDAINETMVVDLKTAGTDLGDIARTVHSFGYHVQQAHYTAVLEACGQEVDDFLFVFVSRQAPHMVRVIRLEPTAVDLGREQMAHALETWRHCTENNHWPGYQGIDTLDLPAWAYSQADDELEIVIT